MYPPSTVVVTKKKEVMKGQDETTNEREYDDVLFMEFRQILQPPSNP